MVQRVIYDPNGFKNVEKDGKAIGWCFGYKAQYYRGFSLSIVRGVKITVDGEEVPQDAIRFTNKGETFTLDEMTTVVDADLRWEFGIYGSERRRAGCRKASHRYRNHDLPVLYAVPECSSDRRGFRDLRRSEE